VSICVPPIVTSQRSIKCIPPFDARHWLGRHVPAATNTRNTRRIVGRVIFSAVGVLSKERMWVCLCIPLSFPGNSTVKTFLRQRRIVGGVVFYAVPVVSKESLCLALTRTFCKLCYSKCLSSVNTKLYSLCHTS
jgi:hypothetical protein